MWLHLALLSYLPWCRTMDSFQFSTPLFPTLPGILISNRNVCEYAWEQIFGRHGDAFRILKSSHCSQWRTVWDIHDHYWDCSELAIIPLHNILDEHSDVSISICRLPLFMDETDISLAEWTQKSKDMQSFSTSRFGLHLGTKGCDIWKSTSDIHTDAEQI